MSYYADTLTRGFVQAGSYIPFLGGANPPDKFSAYEDPTYLGFTIRFLDFPLAWGPDGVGEDYMPMGLLYDDNKEKGDVMPLADGAQAFFRRRGEYYRAKMIKQFRNEIISLQNNTPWVFEKITGLADLWKIVPNSPWRGKEKVLKITCSESISLRMTHLLDLYRKSMWDAAYARWAAPDLQRYFAMEIIISEIRNMQIYPGIRAVPAEQEGGIFQALQGIPAANNLINSEVGNSVQNIVNGFRKSGDAPARTTIWNTGTYMRFLLDMCELDPFSEGPKFLDATSSAGAESMAKDITLSIKVGRVREYNTYSLLGAMLVDTYSAYSRGIEEANALIDTDGGFPEDVQKSGNDLPAWKGLDADRDFYQQDAARDAAARARKNSPIGIKNNNSLPGGGGGPTTGNPPNPLIPASARGRGPLAQAVQGVIAQGLALAEQAIDNALGPLGAQERLGNVYDMNPASLANILGILTNPGAAAVNFLSAKAGEIAEKLGKTDVVPPTTEDIATAIAESGSTLIDPDGVIGAATFLSVSSQNQPQLVQNLLGAVEQLSQQVAGTSLENQSISYIISATASENLPGSPETAELTSAPSSQTVSERVDLQAPSILNTTLGKILLEGSDGTQLQGAPGKVVLSAAYAAPETPDLGKEPLRGKRSSLRGTPEKTDLLAPTVEGAGSDTAELSGPNVPLEGEVQPPKIIFESTPVAESKDKNVGLRGAEPPSEKNLGKVDLQ